MANRKPILKGNLRQPKSPSADLDDVLEEIEREREDENQLRLDRMERFIRLHGHVKWETNPTADRRLCKVLRQQSEDVWSNFISILGGYSGGEIQECKNEARYTRHGEFPWEVALRKIAPSWRGIMTTARSLEMWVLVDAILQVFDVPDKDEEEANDCSSPNSEAESGIATSLSSMANGKEPEENDDHNNSEFSGSPNEEDRWAKLGIACAAPRNEEARRKFVAVPDLDSSPPSYSTEPAGHHSPLEVGRAAKTLGSESPSQRSLSPPTLNKLINHMNNLTVGAPIQDDVLLWKKPQAQQLVGEAATNSGFYSEEQEAPNTSRPYSNPFSQAPTSGVPTPPQHVMYPTQSMGNIPGYPPNSQMICVMTPYGSMQSYPICYPPHLASMQTPTTAPLYSIPMSSFVNGQTGPTTPVCVAPPSQHHFYVNSVNNAHFSNIAAETTQQSTPSGDPVFSSAPSNGIHASETPVINSTNPFAADLNVRSAPRNDNWASLPVQTASQSVVTPPPALHPTNATSSTANASGSASLPNLNQNDMVVFLTNSRDAENEAEALKGKLRKRFPGIRIITHAILSGTENYTTPEKIHRIFGTMDYIIPIISPQYLEDVKVEVAASNPEAGAIRALHVQYLDHFYHNGCKNLKVRALRLPSVTYEQVKTLPTCLSTARFDMEQLISVLHYARTRTPGVNVS